MIRFFKKWFGKYDVPADHTWSKDSVKKQNGVQQAAATNAEIDRVVKDAKAFADAYDSRKFNGQ